MHVLHMTKSNVMIPMIVNTCYIRLTFIYLEMIQLDDSCEVLGESLLKYDGNQQKRVERETVRGTNSIKMWVNDASFK